MEDFNWTWIECTLPVQSSVFLYIVRMGINYKQIVDRIQFICTPEVSYIVGAHSKSNNSLSLE